MVMSGGCRVTEQQSGGEAVGQRAMVMSSKLVNSPGS